MTLSDSTLSGVRNGLLLVGLAAIIVIAYIAWNAGKIYTDTLWYAVGFLFIGGVLDTLSTYKCVKLFIKYKGLDVAIKEESGFHHPFFWKLLGYPVGHIVSSIIEYVFFLLAMVDVRVFSRDLAIGALGLFFGCLVMASICNFSRYKREKADFKHTAPATPPAKAISGKFKIAT